VTDEIDRAQEREQLDRDLALRAAQQRIAKAHTPRAAAVAATCVDCHEAIEPERLRVLRGTCRCAECAHVFEARMKRQAWKS
jgi:RNA polymerase-binding transcription factor DksA